jgi:hypothetical protein
MIDANYIRQFAKEIYLKPALDRGDEVVAIPVKAVETELKKSGFTSGRTPMVCSALSGKKFQQENEIILDHWEGPASGQSTTVIYYFRWAGTRRKSGARSTAERGKAPAAVAESPEARAKRMVEGLRGLLKDEIAAYGGTEGFMRWVRSDEDEAA